MMIGLFMIGIISIILGLVIVPFALSPQAQAVPQFDGPAELPRTVMVTGMSNTPASNIPKIVGSTDNLQAVLNSAQCSDIIQVDPANILTASTVILPTRTDCDAQHWIIITSSGVLPPEGVRIKPGTPMPRIVLTASNSKISGCTFVRLIDFEITRTQGSGTITSLIAPGAGAHDCIFDRVYVHGTPNDETARGFQLSNSTNVAIIDSYISEFHCRAVSGTCGDAQAIAGGLSTSQEGPFLIRNNYLSASGENIMFGGGSASNSPADITIVGNDFVKPDSWNPNDPSYAPTSGKDGIPRPWIVKNLLELKNARRVLVEGNRMVGAWGGFTQAGTAVLFGPKNQAGPNGTNLCPICAVEDVIFRNNWISKTGGALVLGYGASDNGGWPAASARYSVHDNQFDQLQYATCSQCAHFLVQIGSGYDALNPPPSALHDVSIKYNSFILDRTGWLPPRPSDGAAHGFLLVSTPPSGIANIVYNNNVQLGGSDPIASTGGGTNNCFTNQLKSYATALSLCWTGVSSFTGNVIFSQANRPLIWPAGNFPISAGVDPGVASVLGAGTAPITPARPLLGRRKVTTARPVIKGRSKVRK